jgi:hypothetical protein
MPHGRRPEGGALRTGLVLVAVTAVVKAAVVLACVHWIGLWPWIPHLVQDVSHWRPFLEAVRGGAIPYVDVAIEYPVGAGMLYWALSPLLPIDDPRGLVLTHGIVMTLVDLVNTGLFFAILRRFAPRYAVVMTLLFSLNLTSLTLSPVRFECVVVTFALVGYWFHRRGHPHWAALVWSVGSLFKWYPAFFVVAQEYRALVVEGKRWQWVRSAAILIAVNVAAHAPFVLLDHLRHGHIDHVWYPYWFHINRPLYWDTVLGMLTLWLGPQPYERWASLLSLGLMAAALLVRPSLRLEYKGVLICLASLIFNRVYSPQFHLWFYPLLLAGIAEEERPRRRELLALFVVLDVLNAIVYPLAFPQALLEVRLEPFAAVHNGGLWTVVLTAAIFARTLVIVDLAWALFTAPPKPRSAARV